MIAWEMDALTRRFTRVSGGAQAVLGYPAEHWQGVPGLWIGVLHPEDRERVARAVWRAMRLQEPCEIEYRAVASDGSIVRLRDRVRVVRDATGSLLLQGSIIDLTERLTTPTLPPRKRSRRWRRYPYDQRAAPLINLGAPAEDLDHVIDLALAEQAEPEAATPDQVAEPAVQQDDVAGVEDLVSALDVDAEWVFPFEPEITMDPAADVDVVVGPAIAPEMPEPPSLPDEEIASSRILRAMGVPVVASDPDHRIVYWNAAAASLLGWSADEALGRIDAELLRTRAAAPSSDILRGLVDRRPWTAEVEVRAKDERIIPVRITASALRGTGDRIVGYVAVVTDLGHARIGDPRRSAAASMDAVARLARGIGEELKLGVARIEAAVRTALARIPGSDPGRASLDESLRGIDAAAALAAQLLAVGRSAAVGRSGRVDLGDTVRRTLAAVELLAGPGIEIDHAPPAVATPVEIEASIGSQVLLNLVAGSAAALGGEGRIGIAVRPATLDADAAEALWPGMTPGDWVVLEVVDHRPILPDSLETFFEPFRDPSRSGTAGLGLAAAHGLVSSAGGVLLARRRESDGLSVQAWFRSASEIQG